ncbi:MAG: hypothetical protein PHE79_11165 [Eubacteriales bacterium]|nr:hypothetical protein [Eubacteriales bacterium]
MKIGFYCATSYHVMVAVNLMLTKYSEMQGTIYILNHFQGVEILKERLESTGLFEEVIIIKLNNKSLSAKIRRIVGIVFPCKELRSIYNHFTFDEFIFFAYDFINATLIIKKSIQQGCTCNFAFGDDGVGSYFGDIYTPPKKVDLILKIMNRKIYLSIINTLYVFVPELVFSNLHLKPQPIPHFDYNNARFRTIMRSIWPNTLDKIEEKKIVYFQEKVDDNVKSVIEQSERLIFCKIDELGKLDSTIIKLHPRTDDYDCCPKEYLLKDRTPFEVFLFDHNIEDKILISVFSTTLFTPFLLFGQRPKLILTHKLLGDTITPHVPKLEHFLTEFITRYGNEKRIFVPENIDEFKAAVAACLELSNN